MADRNDPQPEEIDLDKPNPAFAKRIVEQAAQSGQAAAEPPPLIKERKAALEDQITPGMSAEEIVNLMAQAPVDSLLPWEPCELPSRGLYYDGWDGGSVMIRPMGTVAEKVLTHERLAKSGESISYLFKECCQLQGGMDPDDLLLGDRVYLLYYLRGVTFGNIYEFIVTCPNPECQAVSTHAFNINEIATTTIWADPALGSEPFRVSLPYASRQIGRDFYVGLRFLRARDGRNMLAVRRQKRKFVAPTQIRAGRPQAQKPTPPNQPSSIVFSDTVTDNLEMCITSIMGVEDRFKIKEIVRKMHSEDSSTIREWIREHSPGIETIVTMTCGECSTVYPAEIPITESFFRPTKSGGVREGV